MLASLAVPTHQAYLQKTQFIEVVQHSHALRAAQSGCLLQEREDVSAYDTFTELAVPAPKSSGNV